MPSEVSITTEVENALLQIALNAEDVRSGASDMLNALMPVLGDEDVALAASDLDGISLHVLAETTVPRPWPARLSPQAAISGARYVDPETSALVVPLRVDGRVRGALLFGNSASATAMMDEGEADAPLETAGIALRALLDQALAVVWRRAASLRTMDHIIHGMAHQMSNPLTGASAIAQLLAEELEDPGQRAALAQIRNEMSRAFVVLNDMLAFQRETYAHDGFLDLTHVVDRVIRFRSYAIREQGIALAIEQPPDPLHVRADARSLEYALTLVVLHAERESRGTVNRSIAVRLARRDDSSVSIEVTDSGPGAAPTLATRYFDQRLRVDDSSREQAAQPDLGLADSLIRGSGGRIEVTSSKTSGTTIAIVLPRARLSSPAISAISTDIA